MKVVISILTAASALFFLVVTTASLCRMPEADSRAYSRIVVMGSIRPAPVR